MTKDELEEYFEDLFFLFDCDIPSIKWTTQDGEKMTLGSMRMRHLRNAIKSFRRRRKDAQSKIEHYRRQISEFPETKRDFVDLIETNETLQTQAEITEFVLIKEFRRRMAEKRKLTNPRMIDRVRANLEEKTNRRLLKT